ncbi:MAG: EF-hand domain-containing protein [Pseudomonadota bacterium]
MKITAIALGAGLLSAGVAMAASETFISADADGSGSLSVEEVVIAMPSTTPEEFSAADADGDGALNAAEFDAAMQTGLLRTGG